MQGRLGAVWAWGAPSGVGIITLRGLITHSAGPETLHPAPRLQDFQLRLQLTRALPSGVIHGY